MSVERVYYDKIQKLEDENKQLKAELETVSDKLGNELQVKVLEIEELKQKLYEDSKN